MSPEIEMAVADMVWAYRNKLEINPDKYKDKPVGFVGKTWAENPTDAYQQEGFVEVQEKWTAQLCV